MPINRNSTRCDFYDFPYYVYISKVKKAVNNPTDIGSDYCFSCRLNIMLPLSVGVQNCCQYGENTEYVFPRYESPPNYNGENYRMIISTATPCASICGSVKISIECNLA